jgi:hypothetical protein
MVYEILDRSRESGWVHSAGPYSLSRILLSAFHDIKLMAPTPALAPTGPTPAPYANGTMWNEDSLNRWKAAAGAWKADAETAGAKLELPLVPGDADAPKPSPLGRIIHPAEGQANAQINSNSSTAPASLEPGPGAVAPAPAVTSPVLPAVNVTPAPSQVPRQFGFYIQIHGQWVPMPKNNGHYHQGFAQLLLAKSSAPNARIAEVIFDGSEALPLTDEHMVTILFVSQGGMRFDIAQSAQDGKTRSVGIFNNLRTGQHEFGKYGPHGRLLQTGNGLVSYTFYLEAAGTYATVGTSLSGEPFYGEFSIQ